MKWFNAFFQRALLAAMAAGVASCASPGAPTGGAARVRAPDAVVGKSWRWVETVTPSERLGNLAPDRYTLELQPNGRAVIRADCNRGNGSYEISAGRIKFGPIATTRMMCPPGSQGDRYARDLARAAGFYVEGEDLFLELSGDTATMHFEPAR